MKIKNGRITYIAIALIFFSILLSACSRNSNDSAEAKEQDERSITVINETEEVLKDITIKVDKGTEVAKLKEPNPEETSVSITIPKEYEEHKEFKVVVTDLYGGVYEKDKTISKPTGRFEVTVTKDDLKKSGNILDKIFNKSK